MKHRYKQLTINTGWKLNRKKGNTYVVTNIRDKQETEK